MVQAGAFSGGMGLQAEASTRSFSVTAQPIENTETSNITSTILNICSGMKSTPGDAEPDDGNQEQAQHDGRGPHVFGPAGQDVSFLANAVNSVLDGAV